MLLAELKRMREGQNAEEFEAESGQMCEVCHVNDDLPYDADHFKECRRCSKSVCLECWDEMEHDEKFGIVCGSCWVVLDNVAQFGAETFEAQTLYRGARPSPSTSATSVNVGTEQRGGNGKMWVCKSYPRGSKRVKRWVLAAEEFGAESRESSTLPCYCERCDNYTDLDGKGWILLSGELLCPNCESKESSTLPVVCEQCDNYEDLEGEGWSLLSGELLCPNCGLKEYKSEANGEGTFYDEGRTAANDSLYA